MKVGKIRPGEEKDFQVEPGFHEIRLKIDLAGSQCIKFEIADGGRIGFQCEPNEVSTTLNDAIGAISGGSEPWVNLWRSKAR
jgi:hypothetical protein